MNEHPLIPDTQADKNLGLPEADTDVSVPLDGLGLEWHSRGCRFHNNDYSENKALKPAVYKNMDPMPKIGDRDPP